MGCEVRMKRRVSIAIGEFRGESDVYMHLRLVFEHVYFRCGDARGVKLLYG